MRIIQKFTLYLVGFIFMLAIYSGIILKLQLGVEDHLDDITLGVMPESLDVSELSYNIQRLNSNIRELFLEMQDPVYSKEEIIYVKAAIKESISNIQGHGLFLEKSIKAMGGGRHKKTDDKIKTFKEIKIIIDNYLTSTNIVLGLLDEKGCKAALEFWENKVEPISRELHSMVENIEKSLVKDLFTEIGLIRKTVTASVKISIILSVFAVLAGTFFNYLIARSIVLPLAKLKNATVEINNGKIGTKAEINLKDEIGEFAVSFNCMSENLQKSNKKIQEEMQYIEVINKELQTSMEEAESSNKELRQSNEKLESATKELHLIGNMAQKAKEIAEKKVEEVEQFNKIAVGRELRIRELKERVAELEEELKRRGS